MKTRPLGIPGMRVGSLVAVELVSSTSADGGKRKAWRCRCDCGAEVFHPAYALRGGRIRSCGCSKRQDLIGRLGNLEIVGEAMRISDRVRVWICLCKCGNTVEVSSKNLKRNRVDCGCGTPRRRALADADRSERSRASKSTVKRQVEDKAKNYRYRSKNRGFENSITTEEFARMAMSPCSYCGGTGVNGVDRVDNDKGYVDGNCVPCCSTCNYMKRTMTEGDFIAHVSKIVEYQKRK